jgi:hypothetical protein
MSEFDLDFDLDLEAVSEEPEDEFSLSFDEFDLDIGEEEVDKPFVPDVVGTAQRTSAPTGAFRSAKIAQKMQQDKERRRIEEEAEKLRDTSLADDLKASKQKEFEGLLSKLVEIEGTQIQEEPVEIKPLKEQAEIEEPVGFGETVTIPVDKPRVAKGSDLGKTIKSNLNLFRSNLNMHRGKALGQDIRPITGEKRSDGKAYFDAIKKEDDSGRAVLEKLKITPESFEYTGVIPSQASLEKLLSDEKVQEFGNPTTVRDVARGYLARQKQSNLTAKSLEQRKTAEKALPLEDRILDLYSLIDKKLDGKEKLLGSTKIKRIKEGWDIGGVNKKIDQALGALAAFSPDDAAKLIPAIKDIQKRILEAEESGDQGKFTNAVASLTEILNPMITTTIPVIGGQVLSTIYPPAALLTAPLSSGYMLEQWGSMAAGQMFQDMVESGRTPEEAASMAIPAGLIHAMVETVQVGQFAGAGQKAFKEIVKNVAKEKVKTLSKNGVKKITLKLLKESMPEILEEAIQGAIEKGVVKAAETRNVVSREGKLGEKGKEVLLSGFDGFVENGIQSAPHMVAIAALSMITGGVGGKLLKGLNVKKNKRHVENVTNIANSDLSNENKTLIIQRYFEENPEFYMEISKETSNKLIEGLTGETDLAWSQIVENAKAKQDEVFIDDLVDIDENEFEAEEELQEDSEEFQLEPDEVAVEEVTAEDEVVGDVPVGVEETIATEGPIQVTEEVEAPVELEGVAEEQPVVEEEVVPVEEEVVLTEEPLDKQQVEEIDQEVSDDIVLEDIELDTQQAIEDEFAIEEEELGKLIEESQDIPVAEETLDDVKKIQFKAVEAPFDTRFKGVKAGREQVKIKEYTVIGPDGFEHEYEATFSESGKKDKIEDLGLTENGIQQAAEKSYNDIAPKIQEAIDTNENTKDLPFTGKLFVGKRLTQNKLNKLLKTKKLNGFMSNLKQRFIKNQTIIDKKVPESVKVTKVSKKPTKTVKIKKVEIDEKAQKKPKKETKKASKEIKKREVKPVQEANVINVEKDKIVKKFLRPGSINNIKVTESDTYNLRGEQHSLKASKEQAAIISKNGKVEVFIRPDLSPKAKSFAIVHELVGHFGISNLMKKNDPKVWKTIQEIYQSQEGQDLKLEVEQTYADDLAVALEEGPQAYDDMLLSEWLAHGLERSVAKDKGVFQRIKEAIKQWLVNLGIATPKNVDELINFLQKEMRQLNPQEFVPTLRVIPQENEQVEEIIRLSKKLSEDSFLTKEQLIESNTQLKERAKKAEAKQRQLIRARKKYKEALNNEKVQAKDFLKFVRAYISINLDEGLTSVFWKRFHVLMKSPFWKGKLNTPQKNAKAKASVDALIRTLNSAQRRRQAIQALKKVLKTAKKTEKKAQRSVRDIIKKALELDTNIIKRLSTEQIIEIAQNVQNAIEFSKAFRAEVLKGQKDILEENRVQAESNLINNRRVSPSGEITASGKQDAWFTKMFDNLWGIGANTGETIAWTMDNTDRNSKEGAIGRVVFGGMHNALKGKLQFLQEVEDTFKEKFDYKDIKDISTAFKDSVRDTKKIVKELTLPSGQKVTLTPGQQISFYLHGQNSKNRKALLEGFEFDSVPKGKDFIHQLETKDLEYLTSRERLSETEAKLADFISETLNIKSRVAIETTSEAMNGFPMPMENNYFPLHRKNFRKNYLEKGFQDIKSFTQQYFIENAGAFKERKETGTGNVVVEDALVAFYNSINLAASYSNYAMPLRQAKQLLEELKGVSRETGYTKELDGLNRYLRDVESAQKVTGMEKFVKGILGKTAANVLGMNVPVMMRQVGSYFLIPTEIDMKYWAPAATMVPFSEKGKELREKIKQYSPLFRARFNSNLIDAELGGNASVQEVGRVFGKPLPWQEWATTGIHKVDQATITRIIEAAKLEVEDKTNLTGDAKWEAVAKRAEDITIRTQPMYNNEYRSEIGRDPRLVYKLVSMFTSATNAVLNTIKRSYLKYKKTKNFKKFLKDITFAWLAAALFQVVIDEGSDFLKGRWDRDLTKRMFRAFDRLISPFYLGKVGSELFQDAFNTIRNKKLTTAAIENDRNILGVIEDDVVRIGKDLWQAVEKKDVQAGDPERLVRAASKIGNIVGLWVGGLPISNIHKQITGLMKSFTGPKKSIVTKQSEFLSQRLNISKEFTLNKKKYRFTNDGYKRYIDWLEANNDKSFKQFEFDKLKTGNEKKDYIKDVASKSKLKWKRLNKNRIKDFAIILKEEK